MKKEAMQIGVHPILKQRVEWMKYSPFVAGGMSQSGHYFLKRFRNLAILTYALAVTGESLMNYN